MELVYVSLIGGIFSLLSIYLLFTLQTRKMKLDQNYKLKRFREGKKYDLKKDQMPEDSSTKPLTQRGIEMLIDKYIGPSEEEEGEPSRREGLLEVVENFIEKNPDLVKQYGPALIEKVLGQTQQKQEYL